MEVRFKEVSASTSSNLDSSLKIFRYNIHQESLTLVTLSILGNVSMMNSTNLQDMVSSTAIHSEPKLTPLVISGEDLELQIHDQSIII